MIQQSLGRAMPERGAARRYCTTRGRMALVPKVHAALDKQPLALSSASDELFQLLTSDAPDTGRVSDLVDYLSKTQLPFNESEIGGGPWIVRFTKGWPLLWSAVYGQAKVLNRKNRASQAFDPKRRIAVNKAEYFGGEVFVTASGTYEPQGKGNLPKTLNVTINKGSLHAWGKVIPLPISGTGSTELMFSDERIRIFYAKGSYAVQVRESAL